MTANPETLLHVGVADIHVHPTRNTRKHFDQGELQELADSIVLNGVIQPIVIRHVEGLGYELVCGERRYRASKLAGKETVPAYLRDLNDQQALQCVIEENKQREDVSLGEEAVACRAMVDICEGNRDEAAKQLGMSRSTLDGRLMLLNAEPAVLDALAKREIQLGHAELLSTLPANNQTETLPRIIEKKTTVAELKGALGSHARQLATAAFDTSDCNACAHNSSTQASLFETSIGEGNCSNHDCWTQKTNAFVAAKKVEAAGDYNTVFLDNEKDPSTHTVVLIKDLGQEQVSACRGCQHHGALLSTKAGEEGRVSDDTCFKLSCHKKKVAAYKAELDKADPTKSAAGKPAKPTTKVKSPSVSAASSSKQVTGAIYARLGQSMLEVLDTQHERHFNLAMQVYLTAKGASLSASEVLKKHKVSATNLADIGHFLGLDEAALRELATDLAEAVIKQCATDASGEMKSSERTAVRKVLTRYEVPATTAFQVTDEFIDAHTKQGLVSLVEEKGCGFIEQLEGDDKKAAFKKLAAGKVSDFKGALKKFSFDGFIPSAVKREIKLK